MTKDDLSEKTANPEKNKIKKSVVAKNGKKLIPSFKTNKFTELLLSAVIILIAVAATASGKMAAFMGVTLVILSALKLIDVKNFARMFSKYDVLASRIKIYSFAYPFIELLLGMAYLFSFQIQTTAAITAIVMSISAIGVWKNLFTKNKAKCACLGSKIKVPITTVTLTEYVVMAAMGLAIVFLQSPK